MLENKLAYWNHETMGIALRPGMDEVTLGLVADAWSRTYRSSAVTFAASAQPVKTRGGLRIVPDQAAANWPPDRQAGMFPDRGPVGALNQTLLALAARYGESTSDVVRMQLEYPVAKPAATGL